MPEENYPTSFQKKVCWRALTAIAFLVLAVIVVGFFWFSALILGYLQQVLLPIAIAGIIAYLLEPIVSWLEKRRIKRTLAILLVLISFIGSATLALLHIIPPIINQTNELIANRVSIVNKSSAYFDEALKNPVIESLITSYYESSLKAKQEAQKDSGDWISNTLSAVSQTAHLPTTLPKNNEIPRSTDAPKELSEYLKTTQALEELSTEQAVQQAKAQGTQKMLLMALENNSATYGKYLMSWFSSSREILSGGLGWIIGAILVPIFVFVFLKETQSIAERWTDILPIRTSKFKQEVVDTLTEINGYLIAFFRGQMLVSLIDGTMIGVGLWILGMPYAFLIGAAVGILGIVPYIGIFSVFVPTLALSWFVWHDWQHLAWVSLIFLACNQFDSWIIQPKIVGNAVGLHEVTVIFSVIFWSFLFGGIVGALLAVPLTAAVKVIFQRYIWMNIGASSLKKVEKSLASSS